MTAQVKGNDVVFGKERRDGEGPVCGVAGPAVDEEERRVSGVAVGGVEEGEVGGWGEVWHDWGKSGAWMFLTWKL